MRQYGELTCVLISGVLFALFHGNFTQFFYAFGLGALFAYVYFRSGSLILTFLLHAIFNIIAGVLPTVLAGAGEVVLMMYGVIYLILIVVGAVCLLGELHGLKLRKGEIAISRKACVSAAVWNSGMIVSVVCMLIFMASSLFTE